MKTRKATASPIYRVRSDVCIPGLGWGVSWVYTTTGRFGATRSGLHNPPVQFLLVISFPWQYLPPLEGAGAEQLRRLTWIQSVEQVLQLVHILQDPSTAGHIREQDFFCIAGPSQPGPPLTGAGESQVLWRTWTPRPHSTSHSFHSDHSPQLPGTKIKYIHWKMFNISYLKTLNIVKISLRKCKC